MTTKDQERKALQQIRKIVEGLGEDSYIATAFDGCFDDAENNIEDDAAYSWKDRAERMAHQRRTTHHGWSFLLWSIGDSNGHGSELGASGAQEPCPDQARRRERILYALHCKEPSCIRRRQKSFLVFLGGT